MIAFLTSLLVASATASLDIAQPNLGKKIPGQYLVRFHASDIGAAEQAHIKRMGRVATTLNQWDMPTMAGYAVANCTGFALAELLADPLVSHVEQDQYVYAMGGKPEAECSSQSQTQYYNLARMSQRDISTGADYKYPNFPSDSTRVYVADTGILTSHQEFDGARAKWGTDQTGEGERDGNGHGTHCAGTVGGQTAGVSKKVEIIAAKCLNSGGSGSYAQVIGAINWSINDHLSKTDNTKLPASIISMSLGGGRSSEMDQAVEDAFNSEVLVVAAAGNNNADACNFSPASAPLAFTVGSTDNTDGRSSFSNYGGCVNILAPGSSVRSAYIGGDSSYSTLSGTSMACPAIAGVAATVITENPTMKVGELVLELQEMSSKDKVNLKCGNSVCDSTPNYMGFNGCE